MYLVTPLFHIGNLRNRGSNKEGLRVGNNQGRGTPDRQQHLMTRQHIWVCIFFQLLQPLEISVDVFLHVSSPNEGYILSLVNFQTLRLLAYGFGGSTDGSMEHPKTSPMPHGSMKSHNILNLLGISWEEA